MGTTLLYKRACKQALTDTYFDLGVCNKLMKQHPEWSWVVQTKAQLETQERELESELAILNCNKS